MNAEVTGERGQGPAGFERKEGGHESRNTGHLWKVEKARKQILPEGF